MGPDSIVLIARTMIYHQHHRGSSLFELNYMICHCDSLEVQTCNIATQSKHEQNALYLQDKQRKYQKSPTKYTSKSKSVHARDIRSKTRKAPRRFSLPALQLTLCLLRQVKLRLV